MDLSRVTVGGRPLSEIKTFREILWALATQKNIELVQKLKVGFLLCCCRFIAWREGKGLQAILKALVMAIEQVQREEASHDF